MVGVVVVVVAMGRVTVLPMLHLLVVVPPTVMAMVVLVSLALVEVPPCLLIRNWLGSALLFPIIHSLLLTGYVTQGPPAQ